MFRLIFNWWSTVVKWPNDPGKFTVLNKMFMSVSQSSTNNHTIFTHSRIIIVRKQFCRPDTRFSEKFLIECLPGSHVNSVLTITLQLSTASEQFLHTGIQKSNMYATDPLLTVTFVIYTLFVKKYIYKIQLTFLK